MEAQRKTKKSEPDDWLREAFLLASLFDRYGALFDERQREIFEDYICNDMSLAEIAEREGMTRQGVSDLVKRTSRKLREYEDGLHMVQKAGEADSMISDLAKRIDESGLPDSQKEEIKGLLERLSELF
ncbi:MAG: DNA-binding protein [Lachnospiraceae bacterium]|nr:DNA-binding protein [Lachnospiraceae bacterium]